MTALRPGLECFRPPTIEAISSDDLGLLLCAVPAESIRVNRRADQGRGGKGHG